MALTPTPEQETVRGLFASGETMAVEAGAGTGKTSTLDLVSRDTPRHGQYVAFNRAIVDEARTKFPITVDCSTAHSLAFRSVGRQYAHRLKSKRQTSQQVARELGIAGPVIVDVGGIGKKVLQPSWLAGHTMSALARFCFSADPEPGARHFPYVHGIDMPTDRGERTYFNNRQLADHLAGYLAAAWADMRRPDGKLRFSHDAYLKMWQLSQPAIPADYILFDEAQDAAPVMLAAIEGQADTQIVWVGDSQQQIYEWRGAVNALASIDAACRATLSQSFRFGPAIAEAANACLTLLDADLRLAGLPSIPSRLARVADPAAVLCRTNGAAIETVMNSLEAGQTPHLVGGGRELVAFADAAEQLMAGERPWHPELACFSTWQGVKAYVENDPQGDELALMVKIVDKYGPDAIRQALDATVSEANADVVVSTAHKAKGREWRTVRLAGDFGQPDDGKDDAGEWRLLYVAATRAREVLDYSRCEPLVNLLGPCPAPIA